MRPEAPTGQLGGPTLSRWNELTTERSWRAAPKLARATHGAVWSHLGRPEMGSQMWQINISFLGLKWALLRPVWLF